METVVHLLLHSEVASALSYSLFSLFSLDWVMPCNAVDLLTCSNRGLVSIECNIKEDDFLLFVMVYMERERRLEL